MGKSGKKRAFLLVGITLIGFSVSSCLSLASSASGDANQSAVADVADVAEVKDSEFVPRMNPAVQRADGSVYALPAAALNPETERLPSPVYTISGIKGQEISEGNPWEVVDIVVNLPEKESFSNGIIEGHPVNDWILNLPAGLQARAHGVKKGGTSIKIYISGTPEVTGRDVIRVRIPGSYLTSGSDRQFVSPTEEESLAVWEAKQTQSAN
jgi:hypothetical protein